MTLLIVEEDSNATFEMVSYPSKVFLFGHRLMKPATS